MTPPNPSPEAREAAVAIVDGYMKSFLDDEEVKQGIASIIQSALDSAQRPYMELLDEAFKVTEGHWHNHGGMNGCEVCDFHYHLIQEREKRDELRKQVGDNL